MVNVLCQPLNTQAEGGRYDLLARFDNPSSARQGQKMPTNAANHLPEAVIPLGDIDAILLPKQFAIPFPTFPGKRLDLGF
jgi:hypothetical protein